MNFDNRNKFKSRRDAQNRRKPSYACLHCLYYQDKKFESCPECGREKIQYFASKRELDRYGQLVLMQRGGFIRNLEVQPNYRLVVNGLHVCSYRGDFRYRDLRSGEIVLEDVKGSRNEKYLDPVFKLKRKLLAATHGVKISLVD